MPTRNLRAYGSCRPPAPRRPHSRRLGPPPWEDRLRKRSRANAIQQHGPPAADTCRSPPPQEGPSRTVAGPQLATGTEGHLRGGWKKLPAGGEEGHLLPMGMPRRVTLCSCLLSPVGRWGWPCSARPCGGRGLDGTTRTTRSMGSTKVLTELGKYWAAASPSPSRWSSLTCAPGVRKQSGRTQWQAAWVSRSHGRSMPPVTPPVCGPSVCSSSWPGASSGSSFSFQSLTRLQRPTVRQAGPWRSAVVQPQSRCWCIQSRQSCPSSQRCGSCSAKRFLPGERAIWRTAGRAFEGPWGSASRRLLCMQDWLRSSRRASA